MAESHRYWSSDGFEFPEKLRVTSVQDHSEREIIDCAAGTGGYDKSTGIT
ncbi:resolvase (plasmid) [Pantoea agglomerans]|nr:resolvase [Pantoea agglomerans]